VSNKRNPRWEGEPSKRDAAILRRKIKLAKKGKLRRFGMPNDGKKLGRSETRKLRAEQADKLGYETGRDGHQPWTCTRPR
jgi:hypothetical protein